MQNPHAYCTYFDSGYLSRGVTLIASLRAHGDDSPVWIMALDDIARDYLMDAAIPGVHVISVAALEAVIPELGPLRATRSRMEYYFTCTPLLIRYVMDQAASGTAVIYLDADLYFFDDPSAVLTAMGSSSVGIIEHKYPTRLQRRLAKYGRFNVGWVGFADDAEGRAVLDFWGSSTLEWCSDTPQDGKYADQGYLDRFPAFPGVAVLPSPGMNLAPWNTSGHNLGTDARGTVLVGDAPLVFFHFHGLKRSGRWWISAQLVYGAGMGAVLRDHVYRPYIEHLERVASVIADSPLAPPTAISKRGVGLRGVVFRAQASVIKGVAILTRSALPAGRASR
ncbi:MAG: hypothetical protein KF761_05785 [Salinibacterium sp.]|nr:hypothetical protein [Salinibacterium sp.]